MRVLVFALLPVLQLAVAQSGDLLKSADPRVSIQSRTARADETVITVTSRNSSRITAVMASVRRFKPDGGVRLTSDRFYDPLVYLTEKLVDAGSPVTVDLGRQLEDGRDDEVAVRAIVFEDGTALGEPAYISRILARRRVARDGLIDLIERGHQLNAEHADLAAAMSSARQFAEYEEKSVPEGEERQAVFAQVHAFAGNLEMHVWPGHPVFNSDLEAAYRRILEKLQNSRPAI